MGRYQTCGTVWWRLAKRPLRSGGEKTTEISAAKQSGQISVVWPNCQPTFFDHHPAAGENQLPRIIIFLNLRTESKVNWMVLCS